MSRALAAVVSLLAAAAAFAVVPAPPALPSPSPALRLMAATEIKAGARGHFFVTADIDHTPVNVLIDTGASMVALTANDAAMMGVEWRADQVRPVARGASGDVYGVPVVLDRIDVKGIEARRVAAVVVPEGLGISLLGQSFLAKVNRVEVSGDEMVLHD